MKIPKALAVGLLVWLCAGPVYSMVESNSTAVDIQFEHDGEKHPAKLMMMLPIVRTVEGKDGGPLTLAILWTAGYPLEDPRGNKGKLSAVVKIYRDDEVIWNVKMKSKVYEGSSKGLNACNAIDFVLEKGDVVVSNMKFKGMPRFNEGQGIFLQMSVEPYIGEFLAEDKKVCKY